MVGNLCEQDYIVPEKPLINDPYILTNHSSVDSEIRFQLFYQFVTDANSPIDNEKWNGFDDTNNQQIKSSIGDDWVYFKGCWYYGGIIDGDSISGSVIKGSESTSITVLESLSVNGDNYGNMGNRNVKLIIKIAFQAKQKRLC